MGGGDLPIGTVLTLTSGDARAEITTVGAHLRSLSKGGRALILPFGDELPWGAHGAVLAPWPNRIRDGRYTWDGRTYQLPITELDRNTAIHGLVMGTEWEARATGTSAVLTTELDPSPGYPFPLRLRIEYTLSGSALDVTFSATNLGSRPAPFGVGFHPWLDAGPGGLEEARLQFSAGTWFQTDSRLLPTVVGPVPAELDFTRPRVFGAATIDDGFGVPARDSGGRSWVRLDCADGTRIAVWMDSPLDVWQLCSHPGDAPRPGLAVEPMSCPADAFNTGIGLQTLDHDAVFSADWGLVFSRS